MRDVVASGLRRGYQCWALVNDLPLGCTRYGARRQKEGAIVAVTVFTQGTTTNDRRKENHEAGQFVSVRDGHLFVLSQPTDNPASCVAVYAPGKWISAQR